MFVEETGQSVAFLDVKVTRENDCFSTSIYQRLTFTEQGMIFQQYIP